MRKLFQLTKRLCYTKNSDVKMLTFKTSFCFLIFILGMSAFMSIEKGLTVNSSLQKSASVLERLILPFLSPATYWLSIFE